MVVVLVAGIGLLLGGLRGGRVRNPAGLQLRQHADLLRCDRGLHRGDRCLASGSPCGELKAIAGQSGSGVPAGFAGTAARRRPLRPDGATLGDQAPDDGGFLFSGDQPAAEHAGHARSCARALARGGRLARSRRCGAAAPVEAAPRRQAAAQPAVFLDLAEGARAGRGGGAGPVRSRSAAASSRGRRRRRAASRTGRSAARDLRRCLAEIGTREDRRRAAAARGGRAPSTFHRSRPVRPTAIPPRRETRSRRRSRC